MIYNNLHDFWQSRARYTGTTEAEYNNSVVKEFEKTLNAPDDSVIKSHNN